MLARVCGWLEVGAIAAFMTWVGSCLTWLVLGFSCLILERVLDVRHWDWEERLRFAHALDPVAAALLWVIGVSFSAIPALSAAWLVLAVLGWFVRTVCARWEERRLRRLLPSLPEGTELRLEDGCVLEVPGPDRSLTIADRDAAEAALLEPVATGDPAFDARFLLTGDPDVIASALDPDTRALLLRSLRRGDRVGDGVVAVRVSSTPEVRARGAVASTIGARLRRGDDERLVRAVAQDPSDAMRVRALRALAARSPERGRALAEALVGGTSDRVRAAVAAFVGAGGAEVLRALLRSPDRDVRVTALESALHRGDAGLLAEHDPADAVALAELLESAGDARYEPLLLALLDGPAGDTAARALGAFGSVRAVGPLLARGSRAARDAAAAIQARTVGAVAGQVSLALGGEVSVVTGGGLAMVPER